MNTEIAVDEKVVAGRQRIVNRKINPLLADLPDKFQTFQPEQIKAVTEILDALTRVDVVFLDAPTGSGKTVIGEVVRRMTQSKAIYSCSSKSLQDQFVADFPYARVLKGRSNYPTESFPSSFHPWDWMGHVSCDDCNWKKSTEHCDYCTGKSRCPYEIAKRQAIASQLAVVNMSYFLAEVNNIGRFSEWPLVIVDEAHTLEAGLMGYVSVDISQKRMDKYGLQPPNRVTVKESWAQWIDETLPVLLKVAALVPDDGTKENTRELKYLGQLHEKLTFVRAGLDDGYWVYNGKEGQGVKFEPSRVDKLGNEYLWRHGKKWLLMSATLISSDEMAESLGLDKSYETIVMPSKFPVENRRIVYRPVADMTHKKKDTSWGLIADDVAVLATRHSGDRVLVHSVSYDLTRTITDRVKASIAGSNRKVLSYTSAGERDKTLAEFIRTPRAILVAPSMDTGIDLPGDDCRVQIIVKCPFPFLNRVTSARLYSRGGQVWYTVQTIRTIVQMSGRAVRNKDDYATTYILDTQFESGVWSRGRNLFPKWFAEAIDWKSERKR